jgi:hypothetical protein
MEFISFSRAYGFFREDAGQLLYWQSAPIAPHAPDRDAGTPQAKKTAPEDAVL